MNGAPGAWPAQAARSAAAAAAAADDGGPVAACPGLFGQVGAGPQACRQQPPAQDGQVRGFDQREHPPDLGQGVTGAPVPQGQLRGPLPRLADEFNVAEMARDGVDQPVPPRSGIDIGAQQVDLGAGLVRQPVIVVRRPGGQRVDQRRGLRGAPAGEQRFGGVGGHDR